ncbi:MAG TPA: hypothetical protein VN457_01640, partial [Chlamydiales bacterium]|nr:hypothetical protein [Chlamydiales bacterium]
MAIADSSKPISDASASFAVLASKSLKASTPQISVAKNEILIATRIEVSPGKFVDRVRHYKVVRDDGMQVQDSDIANALQQTQELFKAQAFETNWCKWEQQNVVAVKPGVAQTATTRIALKTKQVFQKEMTSSAKADKAEKQETVVVAMNAFKVQLEALREAGYSEAVIRQGAQNIMNEGHLRLAALMDPKKFPFADEWNEQTLSDLLQMPGNEELRAAIVELAQAEPTEETAGKKVKPDKGDVKACQNLMTLFILQKKVNHPRVIESRNPQGKPIVFEQRMTRCEIPDVDAYLADAQKKGVKFTPQQLQGLFTESFSRPSEAEESKQGKLTGGAAKLIDDQVKHCTNLGAVRVINHDGKVQSVILRSGNAKNDNRLRELTLFAMTEQLQVQGKPCLRKNEKTGEFEFQHVVSSYKDFSKAKELASKWVPKFMANVEDEKPMIKGLVEAADSWPEEGYKIRVEMVGDDGSVKTETVVLKKPIICNQFLSGAVEDEGGIEESDACNIAANQRLFTQHLALQNKDVSRPLSGPLIQSANQLNNKLKELFGSKVGFLGENGLIDFEKVKQWQLVEHASAIMESKELLEYQKQVASFLLDDLRDVHGKLYAAKLSLDGKAGPEKKALEQKVEALEKQKNTLICLFATLFRRTPPEPPLQENNKWFMDRFELSPKGARLHALDMEIYRHNLCESLGFSKGKQCKSGSDRTGVGVAAEEAAMRFKMETGKTYMPTQIPNIRNPEDLERWQQTRDYKNLIQYKQFFREALFEHGC